MAIIICPECGKEISDQSVKCINCGYPLKKRRKIWVPLACALVTVGVAVFLIINPLKSMSELSESSKGMSSVLTSFSNQSNKNATRNYQLISNNYRESSIQQTTIQATTKNNDYSIPSEKEYTDFVCEWYNQKLNNLGTGYMSYSLEKHAYQFHMGPGFIDAYKYLDGNDPYYSLKAYDDVFKDFFLTYNDLSAKWANNLEYVYGGALNLEILSPTNEEVIVICRSGDVVYSKFYNLDKTN